MSEWEYISLGEFAEEITVGFVGPMATEYVKEGIPFLRSQNVIPFLIDTKDIKFISPEFHQKLKKSALKPNDVVVVRTGKPGASAVIPKSLPIANCSDLVIVRCGEKLNPNFTSYFINSVNKTHVQAHIVGAVQQHFNVGSAKQIQIPKIEIAEQIQISSILCSLDDKIDLLQRQNKTLEQLAKTLFRQWFVEEADESWEKDSLKNLIELQRGISYSGSTLGVNGIGVPMHSLNSIDINGSYKFDGIKYYTGEVKDNKKLKPGDLLIINTDITQDNRIIGWPIFVPDMFPESVCTHHLYLATLLNEKVSKFYLYFLLRYRDYRETLANASNGTTVSMLSKEAIGSVEIKIPPKEKRIKFEEAVRNFLDKQTLNQKQITSLTQLRDTLLPKLMSGEVRVNN